MNLNELVEKIINGHEITKDEAMKLWDESYEKFAYGSEKLKRKFCGNSFDLCTIISAKSGKCSEDCTYCAQSIYYETLQL